MKFGPFILLPAQLAIEVGPDLLQWEKHAAELVSLQRYIPWWLGDLVNYGEAQWGDDFWQALPLNTSESMMTRYASVARQYKPHERFTDLSFTHHTTALRAKNLVIRRSLLRAASQNQMNNESFRIYVKDMFDA